MINKPEAILPNRFATRATASYVLLARQFRRQFSSQAARFLFFRMHSFEVSKLRIFIARRLNYARLS